VDNLVQRGTEKISQGGLPSSTITTYLDTPESGTIYIGLWGETSKTKSDEEGIKESSKADVQFVRGSNRARYPGEEKKKVSQPCKKVTPDKRNLRRNRGVEACKTTPPKKQKQKKKHLGGWGGGGGGEKKKSLTPRT